MKTQHRMIAQLALWLPLVFGQPAWADHGTITIRQFEVTRPAERRVRIRMTAECEGLDLGSFCVRLSQGGAEDPPAGFFRASNGCDYLAGGGFEPGSPNLQDNGPRDEEPAEGSFAVTIDTRDWPDGKYLLSACAHNRPADGPYIHDHRLAPVVIGDADLAANGGSNIRGSVHRIVYQQDGVYACFPSLTVVSDLLLVTGFGTRARRSHIDPTGGSLRLASSDGGRSWTEAKGSVIDARWKTERGQLVRASARGWVYTDATEAEHLHSQHKTVRTVRPGTVAYLGGAQFLTSDDNGRSWQQHELDVPDYVSGLMGYHSEASNVVTPEGLRLVAVYGRRINQERPSEKLRTEVFLLRSTDDGQTWEVRPMYPAGLPDPELGFDETALVVTGGGKLLAMMRTTPEGHLYRSVSEDAGATWSPPEKTPIWGYPAHLLKLHDGRLLCSYGYRRDPMGIRASVSSDDGATWDIEHEYILRADGFGYGSDLGYPLTHQLPGGELVTIYYHTTNGVNTHIATTHWRVEDKQTCKKEEIE